MYILSGDFTSFAHSSFLLRWGIMKISFHPDSQNWAGNGNFPNVTYAIYTSITKGWASSQPVNSIFSCAYPNCSYTYILKWQSLFLNLTVLKLISNNYYYTTIEKIELQCRKNTFALIYSDIRFLFVFKNWEGGVGGGQHNLSWH